MTRNLDKRVEIAWPVNDPALRARVLDYFTTMLSDTAKLRELQSDGTFTDLCAFVPDGRHPFDAQDHLIKEASIAAERARAGDEAKHRRRVQRREDIEQQHKPEVKDRVGQRADHR